MLARVSHGVASGTHLSRARYNLVTRRVAPRAAGGPHEAAILSPVSRHTRRLSTSLVAVLIFAQAGCGRGGSPPAPSRGPMEGAAYGYTVLNTHPHDRRAFTEGLVIDGGRLFESTGSFGEASSLREVDLQTGTVERRVELPAEYFGEGLTAINGRLVQLTWKSQRGFVYDENTLERVTEFTYQGEGWGLTTDGSSLIMSNGSDELRFLDPRTFAVRRSVRVRNAGRAVTGLNELEFVKGEVFANVFPGNEIMRIDPGSGDVVGRADMSGLLDASRAPDDVLNGIASDVATNRLYLTGKRSPRLYEVRLERR